MKLLAPLLVIVVITFSCSPKTETTDSKDSVATVSVSLDTPLPIRPAYDPADSGTFKGFIAIFQSVDELPEWAVTFISDEPGKFTAKELYEADSIYLMFYVQFVPVGPGVDKLYAVTFSKDGTLLSEEALGESYPSSGPDGGGQDYSYTYDPDRKVINVSNSSTNWDESIDNEVTSETWNPYYLNENGQVIPGRKYPEVSKQYLDESDLTLYSKDELKIMRNEIFAVYGYIFKTEPLKSYYGSLPWYKGERDNVDDMLTELEKKNVALIKEVENRK
jgi:hypothetical protein